MDGKEGMHQVSIDPGRRVSSIASDVALLLLQELDQTDREVLILHHRLGLAGVEIAEVLSCPLEEVFDRLEVIEGRALRLANSVSVRLEPQLGAS